MFAEMLQKGLAAGGWVIGFITALGVFLVIVGVIGLALTFAMGDQEDEDDE